MADRSSRARIAARAGPRRRDRAADHQGLRVPRRWGPARIALPARAAPLDRAPGADPLPAGPAGPPGPGHRPRRSAATSTPAPGELVHVDIKKLGSIPDGGGHTRPAGRTGRNRDHERRAGAGYSYLHNAVDDHSRLAYSEILADEKKETAAGVLAPRPRVLRRPRHHRRAGPDRQRLLLPLPRSSPTPWPTPASPTSGPGPTGPRPTARSNGSTAPCSTNGPTPAPTAPRPHAAGLAHWLHTYNHHRGHTALGGQPPASRVTNLSGQYT